MQMTGPTKDTRLEPTGGATSSATSSDEPAREYKDASGATIRLSKSTTEIYATDHHLVNAEPVGGWPPAVQANIDAQAAGEAVPVGGPSTGTAGASTLRSAGGVSGTGSGSIPTGGSTATGSTTSGAGTTSTPTGGTGAR